MLDGGLRCSIDGDDRPRGHSVGRSGMRRVAAHDPDQCRSRDCRQRWRMAKPGLNNKVVRTSPFVLSIVLMSWIVFTVW
jgi:hypothetical protein